jgi:hypothetical protein
MIPSASTIDDAVDTNGKGLENRGGNIVSNWSSTGPFKPVGRGGKAEEYSETVHGNLTGRGQWKSR